MMPRQRLLRTFVGKQSKDVTERIARVVSHGRLFIPHGSEIVTHRLASHVSKLTADLVSNCPWDAEQRAVVARNILGGVDQIPLAILVYNAVLPDIGRENEWDQWHHYWRPLERRGTLVLPVGLDLDLRGILLERIRKAAQIEPIYNTFRSADALITLSFWSGENPIECRNVLHDRLKLHPEEGFRVLKLVPHIVSGFETLAQLIEPDALAEALRTQMSSGKQKDWSDDFSIARDFFKLLSVRPKS
jgi:hypothetical protein